MVRSKGGIDAALDRKVRSYVFSGTFEKCLADLGKVGKISIVGDWRTLAIVGLTRDKQVTLNIKGARVSQLLDVAMARATPRGMHLGWYVDAASGTVRVTTQRGALANRPKAGLVVRSRRTGPTGPTFKFDQAPLSAVVQNFRDLSGLNIHVNWRSLAAINVDRDTAVTMNVSNVSFGRALDLVTDEISGDLDKMQRVYWVIDGGIVRIATGTALDTKLKTRIVDLGELVMPPVDVKMPRRIGLRGTRDSNTNDSRYDQPRDRGRDGGRRIGRVNAGVGIGIIGGGQGDDPADKGEALKENLIEIIKDSIGQDMWSPTGKGTITIMRNRLVVSQTLLGYKLLDRSIGSRKR
ncbi:MAG: hypothetical protein ISS78_08485 [Phycisphaerae bacterium]|nr:hypothetical protein [Phycisphaerae bacterium]